MIRINQIKVTPEISLDEKGLERELRGKIRKLLRLKPDMAFTYRIVKKSVDSRRKPDIFIVYSVDVKMEDGLEGKILKQVHDNNIMLSNTAEYRIPENIRRRDRPSPVIVGFGPAGMFCALMLSRAGYRPVVIEQGEAVEQRLLTVEEFWRSGKLNPASNAQFGEGGAGTFSDGKLNTQVKEVYGRISKVLQIFVEHGAKENILYEAKPHIGTDCLVGIVAGIRREIIERGGQVFFNTRMTDMDISGGRVKSVTLRDLKSGGEKVMDCDTLVLAIGHSARDTFYLLKDRLCMEQKPFAVGLRIEHPQELINVHEFGERYKDYMPASYKLTHKASNGRGVYSFCMCPGGYVVNASSEEGRLAVNGMSYSRRDSRNANAALIVTVGREDFGSDEVLSGIEFQKKLEQAAFRLCDGRIPVQLLGDFEKNIPTTKEKLDKNPVQPCIRGSFSPANLRSILPAPVSEALLEGIKGFERQIPGYSMPEAVFSGVESRTSSPVRIVRDESLQAKPHTAEETEGSGIYPCGEGAGYAGGITSAAVDGIKVYEAIVGRA